MADYYTLLTRKIREINDDPAKMREVVYEAARLALRWQVQDEWPRLSITQSRSHISEPLTSRPHSSFECGRAREVPARAHLGALGSGHCVAPEGSCMII
jgi:hypothetical protein